MAADLTEAIAAAAVAPQKTVTDGTETDMRSVDEMIAADQYAKASAAVVAGLNPWQMLYPARVVLPGSS